MMNQISYLIHCVLGELRSGIGARAAAGEARSTGNRVVEFFVVPAKIVNTVGSIPTRPDRIGFGLFPG